MLKIYQKYLIFNFIKKFINTSLIFLFLVFILNVLEEVNFFKNTDSNFIYPYLLTFLNTPITLFEIFPFIFIISTNFFLYDLYNNNELDLLKKNGLSNMKIVTILFCLSFFIGIFNVGIYYNIAAKLKFYYSDIKNSLSDDNRYLAMVTENGLWIKDEINNKRYIVKSKYIKDSIIYENIINVFNEEFKLLKTIQSEKIDISQNNWLIFNPKITIDNKKDNSKSSMKLISNFNSEKINKLFSNVSSFDIFKLYNLKKDYESYGYSVDDVKTQILKLFAAPFFYSIFTIFSVIIMLNFTKDKSIFFHLIIGILLSVIIYYINFIFNSLGINGKIPITIAVFFPLTMILLISLIGLININEK